MPMWLAKSYISYQEVATFCAFQVALVVENLPANAGDARDMGSIPGSRRSPGVGNGNPLQYFWLENPIDKRSLSSYSPWGPTVHGVTKSQTWLKWLSMSQEIELRPSAVKVQSPNHWTTRKSPKNNSKVMNFQTLKIDKLLEKYKVPDKFKKQVNPK